MYKKKNSSVILLFMLLAQFRWLRMRNAVHRYVMQCINTYTTLPCLLLFTDIQISTETSQSCIWSSWEYFSFKKKMKNVQDASQMIQNNSCSDLIRMYKLATCYKGKTIFFFTLITKDSELTTNEDVLIWKFQLPIQKFNCIYPSLTVWKFETNATFELHKTGQWDSF